MKALSLIQPWAELIKRGQKTIETRKWATPYRGDLLICASKKVNWSMVWDLGWSDVDAGVAVCVVRLANCRAMTAEDQERACCEVYDGAFAWELEDIRPLVKFPVRGSLGLFEVSDELIRRAMIPQ